MTRVGSGWWYVDVVLLVHVGLEYALEHPAQHAVVMLS